MRYPKMQVRHELDDTTLVIEIRHHIGQSYSRSVDPRATRAAKAILNRGRWELHRVDYGRQAHAFDQHCFSIYHYRKAER